MVVAEGDRAETESEADEEEGEGAGDGVAEEDGVFPAAATVAPAELPLVLGLGESESKAAVAACAGLAGGDEEEDAVATRLRSDADPEMALEPETALEAEKTLIPDPDADPEAEVEPLGERWSAPAGEKGDVGVAGADVVDATESAPEVPGDDKTVLPVALVGLMGGRVAWPGRLLEGAAAAAALASISARSFATADMAAGGGQPIHRHLAFG